MRGLLTTLKKIFFWNYERNTWQWDVLCVVILVFIFLTPRWLASGERSQAREHQSPIAKTVILAPEVIANEADRVKIEQQVRTLTGRREIEIVDVRKVVGTDGRVVRFEVDIR